MCRGWYASVWLTNLNTNWPPMARSRYSAENTRLHTLCFICDFLLLWVRKEVDRMPIHTDETKKCIE